MFCALILLLSDATQTLIRLKSCDNTGHGNVWTMMSADSVLNLATYDSIPTNGERFTDPCIAEIDRWG